MIEICDMLCITTGTTIRTTNFDSKSKSIWKSQYQEVTCTPSEPLFIGPWWNSANAMLCQDHWDNWGFSDPECSFCPFERCCAPSVYTEIKLQIPKISWWVCKPFSIDIQMMYVWDADCKDPTGWQSSSHSLNAVGIYRFLSFWWKTGSVHGSWKESGVLECLTMACGIKWKLVIQHWKPNVWPTKHMKLKAIWYSWKPLWIWRTYITLADIERCICWRKF